MPALFALAATALAQDTGATSYTLIVEPGQGLTPIYNLVKSATHTIDMTMYELQDTALEQYLATQAASGVTVRVILDQNLEQSNNQAAYTFLSANGVQVQWANPAYAATHQKTIAIDAGYPTAQAAIMTLNLTPGYYPATRDFAIVENGASDIAAIETVFEADFNGTAIAPPPGGDLVWSPTNSQTAMVGLITSAQHTLLVENEEMSDAAIVGALVSAARRGVNVQVAMNAGTSYSREWHEIVAAGGDVATYASTAPLYIHAKAMLADYGYATGAAFVGSENFSSASLTRNRELGIVTSDSAVMSSLFAIMTSDFQGGAPYGSSPANFTLAPNPAALTAEAGAATAFTVAATGFNGFGGAIALTVGGLPAGVTASFAPSSILCDWGTATLTVTASGAAAAGTYPIGIVGTSGSVANSTAVTLTVSGGSPGFTLAANPSSLGIQAGGSVSSTIASGVSGGFASAVSLSAGGLPAGVTASFSPASIAGGAGTSTLTLTASDEAAAGTWAIAVAGAGGGLTETTTVTLTAGTGGGGELISDGGFESATASGLSAPGWTAATNLANHDIVEYHGPCPHAGANYAQLGGRNNADDTLTQTIAIPEGSTAAPLTFWVSILTTENHRKAYDYLRVEVRNASGALLATPLTLTNLDSASNGNQLGTYFQPAAVDLSAYAGQTIELVFHGTNDSEYATTFLIDDVSVVATSVVEY